MPQTTAGAHACGNWQWGLAAGALAVNEGFGGGMRCTCAPCPARMPRCKGAARDGQ